MPLGFPRRSLVAGLNHLIGSKMASTTAPRRQVGQPHNTRVLGGYAKTSALRGHPVNQLNKMISVDSPNFPTVSFEEPFPGGLGVVEGFSGDFQQATAYAQNAVLCPGWLPQPTQKKVPTPKKVRGSLKRQAQCKGASACTSPFCPTQHGL